MYVEFMYIEAFILVINTHFVSESIITCQCAFRFIILLGPEESDRLSSEI